MEECNITLSKMLQQLFEGSKYSLSQIAKRSWLDLGYVSRLLSQEFDPLNERLEDAGKVKHPSRDTIIKLGMGMGLKVEEIDMLLLLSGYAPLIRHQ